MKRKIIQIDEERCNGCGQCIPNCQEGALQIIDDKARLISDLFCDGLGACIGHCPEGAIEIIEREAEPYNETRVIAMIAPKGKKTIQAHLDHLLDHQEFGFLEEAIQYLKNNNINMETGKYEKPQPAFSGCPGSMARDFHNETEKNDIAGTIVPAEVPSELRQWPIQLHLLNPQASYLKNADLVLAADCAAFAMGNFHARYLKDKSLAIACPKLDSKMDSYVQKLTAMISSTKINSLHVIMMEVPCCGGLLQMARMARDASGRNIPIKKTYLSVQGEILEEEWS